MTDLDLFMLPDAEVSELLAENDLDIATILSPLSEDFRSDLRVDPSKKSVDGSTRELVTVLIATSALIAAATPLLKRALELIAGRPARISEIVLVPVETSKGEVVRGANGEPILHWVERAKLLESGVASPDPTKVAIEGPLGLRIELASGGSQ